MKQNASTISDPVGFKKLKLFWALSRTPHGLIDMTTPAFCALLWLAAFPSPYVILIGILTVFSGYTAVYALNDVIDYRIDIEKLKRTEAVPENYLDARMIRHPMAQGYLSFRAGLTWALAWSGAAVAGAYILNPICVLIFAGGCALEALYCRLLKISYLRTLISGVVKTSGGVAAVYAVDPDPSGLYVLLLFACLFLWEIGGQNIPADWTDVAQDRALRAQTIPVRFGDAYAAATALGCLMAAVAVSLLWVLYSGFGPDGWVLAGALAAGLYLLLRPAIRLFRNRRREDAMHLFNTASYYPLVLFVLVVVRLLF